MNNMYEAQTLWDEYMADTAAKYLTKRGGKMVLLAGSRHIESRDGMQTVPLTCTVIHKHRQ
jgi:uncharacterized iron-regulated protein